MNFFSRAVESLKIGEKFQNFWDTILSFWLPIWNFLVTYQVIIFILIITLIGISLVFKKHQEHWRQIKKIWIYVAFFLTKRQMMIPLVITLARKNGITDEVAQKKLLAIKKRCGERNFNIDPNKRLLLEKEVSMAMYEYFFDLESKGVLSRDPKMREVASDLEFIDQKLVELQIIYNREVKKWNKKISPTYCYWFFRVLGFKKMIPFSSAT